MCVVTWAFRHPKDPFFVAFVPRFGWLTWILKGRGHFSGEMALDAFSLVCDVTLPRKCMQHIPAELTHLVVNASMLDCLGFYRSWTP